MKKILYALVILIVTLTAFIAFAQHQSLTRDQSIFIEELVDDGFLKLEPELNSAYIDPDLWASMNIRLKEDFSASLAIYCCNIKGSTLYWVEVYDLYSGKKLARYSQSRGFKTYK